MSSYEKIKKRIREAYEDGEQVKHHTKIYLTVLIIIIVCLALYMISIDINTDYFEGIAMNKETGIVYSKIALSIPKDAYVNESTINCFSAGIGSYLLNDIILIGGLHICKQIELKKEAKISITYTEDSIIEALNTDPYFKEENLTMAYYDDSSGEYVPMKSIFDKSKRTVTAYTNKIYQGFLIIKEKTRFADKLDLNDFCKNVNQNMDKCISIVAIYNNNQTLCSNIINQSIRQECEEWIIQLDNDVRLCDFESGTTGSPDQMEFFERCKVKCNKETVYTNLYSACDKQWKTICIACLSCLCELNP